MQPEGPSEKNKSIPLLVCWLIYVVAVESQYLHIHWRLRRVDQPTPWRHLGGFISFRHPMLSSIGLILFPS